jgi:hypothetical protein
VNYPCKCLTLNKLVPIDTGIVTGLCDMCDSNDCTNSIEKRKVSIFGVVKEHYVIMRGNEPSIVIQCEGFVGK